LGLGFGGPGNSAFQPQLILAGVNRSTGPAEKNGDFSSGVTSCKHVQEDWWVMGFFAMVRWGLEGGLKN
jgi:hypothetical protein